jgi:tripartite-type tricarboxylate transporter receptor subunit TctC
MSRYIEALALPFIVALASLAAPSLAAEPAWPAKPIHLIVTGGVGGVTDLHARWLADRLGPALGTRMLVENKAGAGGNIGMQFAARSAPDGYTLVVIHQGLMAANPHLYRNPGYDPLADFAPIGVFGASVLILAVNADLPVRSVADLVTLAKSKPGQLAFASPGIGTPPHLAGELFKRAAGLDVQHVPYTSGAKAATDVIAGHIAYSIEGFGVYLPQVQAGRMRALAVTGPTRSPQLPDVPTLAEAGYEQAQHTAWAGIAAPAGTPKPIIDRIAREFAAILASPEGREYLSTRSIEPKPCSPEELAAVIRDEHAKWGKMIREVGLRIE